MTSSTKPVGNEGPEMDWNSQGVMSTRDAGCEGRLAGTSGGIAGGHGRRGADMRRQRQESLGFDHSPYTTESATTAAARRRSSKSSTAVISARISSNLSKTLPSSPNIRA